MNITVDYKKRQYGLGDTVRRYEILLREVDGLYVERPIAPPFIHYETREVEIRFRGMTSSPGRGWDDMGEAEVLGGTLELSHDAARQLANAILEFLKEREQKSHAETLALEVNENPLPRQKRS